MIKKFFKFIGIILLILLILLIIHATRNFIIISKLQDNISKYANSTNYYVSSISTEPNDVIVKIDYYKKDNKEACFINHISYNENSKISLFSNNGKKNMYFDSIEGKTAELDVEDPLMQISIYNTLESESKLQTFLSSIFAYIKSDSNHYIISNFNSTFSMQPEGKNEYYIEKETGLLSKSITNDIISERKYEFNSVNDEIFIEPNINDYISQEDSKEENSLEILYSYTSADSNAANGDPITVDVYEINNSDFKFKYHSTWNETDIEGIAKKVQDKLYVYEYNNQKIEFLFDSFGENSLGVSEFNSDGTLSSKINLFK